MDKLSTKNPVWIVGMRRSGTSMLRALVNMCDNTFLNFEPHDWWFGISHVGMSRIINTPMGRESLRAIKNGLERPGNRGAKFAFNPGSIGTGWRLLDDRFTDARFIFIHRNREDVYASWRKVDRESEYHVSTPDVHAYYHDHNVRQYKAFCDAYPDRAVCVQYEDILRTGGECLGPVWDLLERRKPEGVPEFLRPPEQQRGLAQ